MNSTDHAQPTRKTRPTFARALTRAAIAFAGLLGVAVVFTAAATSAPAAQAASESASEPSSASVGSAAQTPVGSR
jgi:hypothetical protein